MSNRAIIHSDDRVEEAQTKLEDLLEALVPEPVSRALVMAAATNLAYEVMDVTREETLREQQRLAEEIDWK